MTDLIKALNLVLWVTATVTNVTTLARVTKSFEIKIHVSCLIFTDAIISSMCSVLSSAYAVMAVFAIDVNKPFFCSAEFLVNLLPSYLGACITFLVATIRLRDQTY